MNFKLSRKNAEGKWWTYGNLKENQWGNNQASFKVSSLKELIALAEAESKEWVNLRTFPYEAKPDAAVEAHTEAKGNAYVAEPDLDDVVPF